MRSVRGSHSGVHPQITRRADAGGAADHPADSPAPPSGRCQAAPSARSRIPRSIFELIRKLTIDAGSTMNLAHPVR